MRDDFVVRVVDEIASAGGKAIAVQANVTKKAEVERLYGSPAKRCTLRVVFVDLFLFTHILHLTV